MIVTTIGTTVADYSYMIIQGSRSDHFARGAQVPVRNKLRARSGDIMVDGEYSYRLTDPNSQTNFATRTFT